MFLREIEYECRGTGAFIITEVRGLLGKCKKIRRSLATYAGDFG